MQVPCKSDKPPSDFVFPWFCPRRNHEPATQGMSPHAMPSSGKITTAILLLGFSALAFALWPSSESVSGKNLRQHAVARRTPELPVVPRQEQLQQPPPLNAEVRSHQEVETQPQDPAGEALHPGQYATEADVKLCREWLASVNPPQRTGETSSGFASQAGQDRWAYENIFVHLEKLTGRTRGTYLDLAAAFPKRLSNTFFFDVCLGWTGLCIEGDPAKARNFVQLGSSRSCRFVPAIVSDETAPVRFTSFSSADAMEKNWCVSATHSEIPWLRRILTNRCSTAPLLRRI